MNDSMTGVMRKGCTVFVEKITQFRVDGLKTANVVSKQKFKRKSSTTRFLSGLLSKWRSNCCWVKIMPRWPAERESRSLAESRGKNSLDGAAGDWAVSCSGFPVLSAIFSRLLISVGTLFERARVISVPSYCWISSDVNSLESSGNNVRCSFKCMSLSLPNPGMTGPSTQFYRKLLRQHRMPHIWQATNLCHHDAYCAMQIP